MHIIYLHGLGSSPESKKATYFRPFLQERGASYTIPDIKKPSFARLTLTAMLETVAETIREINEDEPIALIGSSMGALAALHFYDRYRTAEAQRVKKIILLAPAFDFMANRAADMGDDWQEQWREAGEWEFHDYALDAKVGVHYGLVEDIMQYDSSSVEVDIPTLIYHGKNDDVVDYQQSIDFAEKHELVTLELLNDDHQLLESRDIILEGILDWLELY